MMLFDTVTSATLFEFSQLLSSQVDSQKPVFQSNLARPASSEASNNWLPVAYREVTESECKLFAVVHLLRR